MSKVEISRVEGDGTGGEAGIMIVALGGGGK
jgi:hypothetical protein